MENQNLKTVNQRFEEIVAGSDDGTVLVTIWNTAPFCNDFSGVSLNDYYFNSSIKLKTQIEFQEKYPDFICIPGISADFGALVEPSAFGCEIAYPKDGGGLPMAQPILKTVDDFRSVKVINPETDGLMPKASNEYRYLWDHLDEKYIEEYGYLKGLATSFGPVELAAVLMGHQNFFMNVIMYPEEVHEVLKVTTESIIRWLKHQERINGKTKRLVFVDHLPGQFGLDHFQEFFLPYSNQVIEEFPDATVIYHNEFPVPYAEALNQLKFDVFHFGGEVKMVAEAIDNDRILMGNLNPTKAMLYGSFEEVYNEAMEVLNEAGRKGSVLLSTAGGISPGTPLSSFEALREAASTFLKENRRP